jgi:hypothetical protein
MIVPLFEREDQFRFEQRLLGSPAEEGREQNQGQGERNQSP